MARDIKNRAVLFLLIVCSVFSTDLRGQFKVAPREGLFGFEEKKKLEYYSPTRYNRCEGLFAAFGATFRPPGISGFSISADAGYGISNETIGYNLGFEYKMPGWRQFKIGGKYFDDTFTNDEWIIGRIENSFASFLLREDFHDYFRVNGFSLWAEKDFEEWLHLRLIYWHGKYESITKETNWSLFGGDKTFRNNPPVAEGQENKLRLEVIWDKLDNPIFPLEGWYVEGALEKGGDFLNGAFDQSGIFITGKYFQRSFANQRMVFQTRYGYRNAEPYGQQHLMDMGGISTLRGYGFKEFRNGNNLLLGSFQYYFNGDLLQRIPLQWIPFYNGLGLILFTEIGTLWKDEAVHVPGVNITDHPEWKSDVGVSLSLTGDFARVDFARRLDRSYDTWKITFRVLPKW